MNDLIERRNLLNERFNEIVILLYDRSVKKRTK